MNDQERIAQLEDAVKELKARLPKHSVSAAMMIELEELEEELETLRSRASRDSD
jgi:HAMP domain-containing protein